jgi:hypothetical protein
MRLKVNPNLKNRPTSQGGLDYSSDIDSLTKEGLTFQNFLLTDIQVTYSEKVQIMTTFGDNEVAYYFGRQPVVYNLSGVLVDAINFEWFTKFVALYQNTLRGSQLAKNYELLEILLPNIKLVGSIMSLSTNQNAARDTDIGFVLQFLAKGFVPQPMPAGTGAVGIGKPMLTFDTNKVPNLSNQVSVLFGANIGSASNVLSTTTGLGSILSKNPFSSITNPLTSAASIIESSFSPVYGILSDITKLINTGGGDIASIINSFSSPVNAILKSINNISKEAFALGTAIDNQIKQIADIGLKGRNSITQTLIGVKNAVGSITRIPHTASQAFASLVTGGRVSSKAAILGGGFRSSHTADKIPLLHSGSTYKPSSGASL